MMKKLSNVVGVVLLILAVIFWDDLMDNCREQYKWAKEHKAGKDGDELGFGEEFDKFFLGETEKPEVTEAPEVRKTPEATKTPEYEEKNTDNGTLLDIHPDEYYSDGYDDEHDDEKPVCYDYLKDAIKAVPKEIKELTTDTEIFDKLTGGSRFVENWVELYKESAFTNICMEDVYFKSMRVRDDGSIIIIAAFDSVDKSGSYYTDYIDFYINKDIVDSLDFSNLNTADDNQQRLDLYGFNCSYVMHSDDTDGCHLFMQGYNFVAK